MSELNDIYRRLEEGTPPSPPEIDLIIKDIRRQRLIYESGGKKAKSVDDDALDEVRTFMKAQAPKKDIDRRF